MEPRILLVEDEVGQREALARSLKREGYRVRAAADGERALEALAQAPYDLVLTDLRLPGLDGLQVLRAAKEANPETAVVLLTGFPGVESSLVAVRLGASEYLVKPVDLERLSDVVRRVLVTRARRPRPRPEDLERFRRQWPYLVGESPAMLRVFEMIERVAPTLSTVLITGETGTGKELIARALHEQSPRRSQPLVTVNCGAIPEELLESELFGHVRGAFTGAVYAQTGKFEAANGGTIFLDEIGAMTLKLQVKMLRILQEREFHPVGGTQAIKVDVRIIAASNQDLETAVAQGRFREDLYYRLNVVPIIIPPLRERVEDIPKLVQHFLGIFNRRVCAAVEGVEAQAMERLLAWSWRGNVRELENLIERLVILKGQGRLERHDLPPGYLQDPPPAGSRPAPLGPEGLDLHAEVERFETALLLQALERTNWNKNRAAQLLGLNRTTLVEKLKRKKLTRAL